MFGDLRCAWRSLRRSPGFTATAVITLALTVGTNTAVFSIADAVLFRPLPYTEPARVFVIRMVDRQSGARYALVPLELLHRITDHHGGLGEVGTIGSGPSVVVHTNEGTEAVPTVAVSANYFGVLGVRPARGRVFEPADASEPGGIAMLTYNAWQQRFGRDEAIVGQRVTLGESAFHIAGVLPKGFVFPAASSGRPELVTVVAPMPRGATDGSLHPIVRLQPSVTREQAQAELATLVGPRAPGASQPTDSLPVLDEVRSVIYPAGQPIMWLLMVAAMLVLLIGWANLAHMLLVRTLGREREMGIRSALGASRGRLVRPLILEATLISVAGALLALLLAAITFDALLRQVPPIAYSNAPVGLGIRVVISALALGVLGGLAFAVLPAWSSARVDVQALIQGRKRDRSPRNRLGQGGMVVQVALAVVLIFGAVLAARAFLAVLRVPLGFTPDNVITIRAEPRGAGGMQLQGLYQRALEAMASHGDVLSVGAVGSMPLDGRAPDSGAYGPDGRTLSASIVYVMPGYFETVGVRLLKGRLPQWQEVRSGADVAVVSEGAARSLFPGRDPLGATLHSHGGRRIVVVGVVGNAVTSLQREGLPPAYVIAHEETRGMTLVVRTRAREAAVFARIRREMDSLVPGTPVTMAWWADSIAALTAYRTPRFQTLVLGSVSVLALGLTALGIFAVVAFSVATRTHEMGIRLAIGATPRSLVALMMRQALGPVGTGLAIGLLATRWLGNLAEAHLFAVQARDPATLAVTAVTVISTAVLAAYLPARRASGFDPVAALRAE